MRYRHPSLALCPGRSLRVLLIALCGLMTLFGVSLQAQQTDGFPEPVEFGEIPDSVWSLEPHHDWPAEYLSVEGEIRFQETATGVQVELEHHHRVKVYSSDPVELAEVALISIPYYHEDALEEVTGIEAATWQPDGTVSRLNHEQISNSELNPRYRVLEFMMPDVREGSVIEYRYVIRRRYIDELPDFYLTRQLPVRRVHLQLQNEDFIRYGVIRESIDFELHYHEELVDTSRAGWPVFVRHEPVSVEHWYACDLPASPFQDHMFSLSEHQGRLMFQISEFGRPRQPLENSWEYVAAQIRRGINSPFDQIGALDDLEELGEEIARQAESPAAAERLIFDYVNRTMVFNGAHRPFPETPPDRVLEGEPSDQAAINLALLAILRGAGLEAWPLYVSDRRTGSISRDFPSLYQFTRLMVAVADGADYRVMDGSWEQSRPELLPVEALVDSGFLLSESDYKWIGIDPEYSLFDMDVTLDAELSSRGDLTGTVRLVTTGFPAREISQLLGRHGDPDDVMKQALFDPYPEAVLSETQVDESAEGEQGYRLLMRSDFRISGYAVSFREGMQFHPMVVGFLDRNPFEEGEGLGPVWPDAPGRHRIVCGRRRPTGYRMAGGRSEQVTGLPGAGRLERYEIQGRDIALQFAVDISRKEFPAGSYGELRRIYERWVALGRDQWYIEHNLN